MYTSGVLPRVVYYSQVIDNLQLQNEVQPSSFSFFDLSIIK